MDKRQQKTRKKLADAILKLATEKPVSEITVSEIALEAQINRSTFYQHSSSAADLLQSTLRTELDQIRQEYLINVNNDYQQAVAEVTNAVLDHVEEHVTIYRQGLGEDSAVGSLHSVLVNHFTQSILLLYSQHSVTALQATEVQRKLAEEMSSHFVAYGTVGALVSWLNSPEPRRKADFLKVFDSVTPDWWPKTHMVVSDQ